MNNRSPGSHALAEIRQRLARQGSVVHFIGIGGVGMAGLAILCAARGMTVSGCDCAENALVRELRRRGFAVEVGHDPRHLDGVDWVVRTPAVPEDAAEIREAVRRGLPLFDRGRVLAALLEGRVSVAVGGTHGKTTTSAMIAHVLRQAGRAPGFCIGGEIPSLGGVADPGGGAYLVVEADESDGTIAYYAPDIAVLTNVDRDHLEHFRDERDLTRVMGRFLHQARQRAIWCADDPPTATLGRRLRHGRSYGWAPEADVRGVVLEMSARGSRVGVAEEGRRVGEFLLPVAGLHNAQNALAAWAALRELECAPQEIIAGLSCYTPVRRRFEILLAQPVMIVSDYAHHPTEIRAVLQMAHLWPARRRLAVFQPHRYTRTRALAAEFPPAFEGADEVVLLPVYPASEPPLEGGHTEDLLPLFQARAGPPAILLDSLEAARCYVRETLREGDQLLVLGAGDVERVAEWARADWLSGRSGA